MMIRPALVTLFLVLQACREAPAFTQGDAQVEGGYASLYDDATLEYWHGRYGPNLRYNLDTLIYGALSDRERRLIEGLELDFEPRGDNDPRTYSVLSPPPVITVSAASIKFLDDLAIASSWLVEGGYSVETVSYYVDMLKYRDAADFPGGRYPAPLPALGIPSDALENRRVDHTSQNALKSAAVFILAHEIGHLVGRHSRYAALEDRVRFEAEADRFATDLFRRIGVTPAGIVLYLLADTRLGRHRGDYCQHDAWLAYVRDSVTHPLSGQRLTALASELRRAPEQFVSSEPSPSQALPGVLLIADQIAGMAPIIEDTTLQKHAAIVGSQIPLSQLRPRRPGMTWIPPGNVLSWRCHESP